MLKILHGTFNVNKEPLFSKVRFWNRTLISIECSMQHTISIDTVEINRYVFGLVLGQQILIELDLES